MANEKRTEFDWDANRGLKWRAQLANMEAMLKPTEEPLIDELSLDSPVRIADVACGGGGTSLEVLRRAPKGSTVHGVDISHALIDAARARAPQGERAIAFTCADVATAPPPDGPYDRLLSRFGVMFFVDPPAALRNLRRWLVPRGRFAFAVWGRPAENAWASVVRDVVAEHVELPPPVPDAPGPFRYGQVEVLVDLLQRAGFSDLDVACWKGELALGGGLSANDAATFALAAFSIAEPVSRASEEVHAKVHHALVERLSRHVSDDVVRLGATVHFVTGSNAE